MEPDGVPGVREGRPVLRLLLPLRRRHLHGHVRHWDAGGVSRFDVSYRVSWQFAASWLCSWPIINPFVEILTVPASSRFVIIKRASFKYGRCPLPVVMLTHNPANGQAF